jgi:beta-aspartyl-peptidase (threonine type)
MHEQFATATIRVIQIIIITGILGMSNVSADSKLAIVIHGGAGTITRASMSDEKEAEIRAVLTASIKAGYKALLAGEPSTNAVTAAINVMEDSPLFNAGKGAVFNAAGQNEMDASIMEGAGLNARQQGFEMMDPAYFHTDFRWQQLQRIKAKETAHQANSVEDQHDQWFSTVGAVALDKDGNLAAGTSTGGTSNKRWGRVGDSPIIGAGTYANNASCAVSATGHGEFFIRYVVAYNICNRVELGASLEDAADTVVNDILVKAKGEGGVIAMDQAGNITTPFNSEGMYRASIDTNGETRILIYREEGEPEGALIGNVEH